MKTNFLGRLITDPQVSSLNNGTQITRLRLGVNVSAKDPETNYRKSIIVDASAFGKTGELLTRSFHKGSKIYVYGTVYDIMSNTGNDGKVYTNISVNLDDFEYVDDKDSKQPAQAQPASAPQQSFGMNAAPQFGAPQQAAPAVNNPMSDMFASMPVASAPQQNFGMNTAPQAAATVPDVNSMFDGLF